MDSLPIRDYAIDLMRRLEHNKSQELTGKNPANYSLSYRRWPCDDKYFGHLHTFTIRKGTGWLANLTGDKMVKGEFYDRHPFGAGSRDITVFDTDSYEMIKRAVSESNNALGILSIVKSVDAMHPTSPDKLDIRVSAFGR